MTFTFKAKTIDGIIQDNPVSFKLECSKAIPVGIQVVRNFNDSNCSIATKVFLIKYGGKTLGSNDFLSKDQYLSYVAAQCVCCPEPSGCAVIIGGCHATVGGCDLLYLQF